MARSTPAQAHNGTPMLPPLRLTLVTMDSHLASAWARTQLALAKEAPGLTLALHVAADYAGDEAALQRCRDDIARSDIVVVAMLFMEDHFQPVMEASRRAGVHRLRQRSDAAHPHG
jgi:magnesium chelatase subunit H